MQASKKVILTGTVQVFIVLASFLQVVHAQDTPKPKKITTRDFSLTQKEIKQITNRFFGNLVTSNTSSGVLGNFASFDAAEGSFSFQGTVSIGDADTTKKNPFISFLSLSAKGDIIGGNYASLFSNSSLNTGISISASYHILVSKPKVALNLDDAAYYEMSKGAAEKQFMRSFDLAKAEDRNVIDRRLTWVEKAMELTKDTIGQLKEKHKGLLDSLSISDKSKWQDWIDKANANETKLQQFEKDYTELLLKQDSLSIARREYPNLNTYAKVKALETQNTITDSLLLAFPLAKHAFAWISFSGGGGKQNYATYDATAPFDNQIQKADYNTYYFGVSLNCFSKNMVNNRLRYFNFGLSRQRTNNLDLLGTKLITDTKKIVNTAGDVTRTVEKKYNAYTDPIIDDEGWKFFLNSYFLFGKKPSGIHFFPEINFQDNKTTIANMGLGYIVSFTNTKKDQPVVNMEIYFKLLDMTDQGGSGISGVWNRNELGLSFTLPINLFTK
jgi:hypothetical protein